jgi:hypothetical protein
MNSEKSNGWTNHETWLVNLWLSNDEPMYREVLNIIRRSAHEPEAIAEYVRSMVEDTGIKGDLITYALASVNWQEIVEGFSEDTE